MSNSPAQVAGVPGRLPDGERVLWQGAPDARAVARHVYHQRTIAAYLGALIVLWAVRTLGTVPASEFASQMVPPVAIAVLALGLVEWLARLTARTSRYVITDRRVILRVGMALSMAVNVPLASIRAAGVRRFRDGTGQIALELEPSSRVAWLALWPHVRAFRWKHPEPLLRGLVAPEVAGAVLRAAALAVTDEAPARADGADDRTRRRALAPAGTAVA